MISRNIIAVVSFKIIGKFRPYGSAAFERAACNLNSSENHFKKHGKISDSSVCEVCHQKFSKRPHMLRHLKTVHMKILPAKCNICNMRFRDNHAAMEHRKIHFKKKHEDLSHDINIDFKY